MNLLMRLRHYYQNVFLESFSFFSNKEKSKLIKLSLAQIALSILDLLGIFLVGVIAAYALNNLQFRTIDSLLFTFINFLGFDPNSNSNKILFLSIFALFFFTIRTIMSLHIISIILNYLHDKGTKISIDLLRKLLNRPLKFHAQSSSQEKLYSITWGVGNVISQVIAPTILLFSDLALITIIFISLLFVDVFVALLSFCLFLILFLFLYANMHNQSLKIGSTLAKSSINFNEKILESLDSYRDITVLNKQEMFIEKAQLYRESYAKVSAKQSMLPLISKYAIELGVIIGSLLLIAIQLLREDSSPSFYVLAVFLTSGVRIAPALLRVQQSLVQIRIGLSSSQTTLNLAKFLNDDFDSQIGSNEKYDFVRLEDFNPQISIDGLGFKYPSNREWALQDISLKIEPGEVIGIAGMSGAGKSTFIDLLLGILEPSEGKVSISNHSPRECFKIWPGKIAYVPQKINLFSGTLIQNIKFNFEENDNDVERVKSIIKLVKLDEFVESLPNKLNTHIGERGMELSGGQIQRIGIARALFSGPKILVFDEANSSLDGVTEFELTNNISSITADCTQIIISHRLSSIKHADKIIYLEKGKIVASGTFTEIRNKVSEFDSQAINLGL